MNVLVVDYAFRMYRVSTGIVFATRISIYQSNKLLPEPMSGVISTVMIDDMCMKTA